MSTLYGMGLDEDSSVHIDLFANPEGKRYGYCIQFSTSGLSGLDYMTKPQLQRLVDELQRQIGELK